MTIPEATTILEKARDLVGHSYKIRIRRAWFNGHYDDEGLESLSQGLQQVRNQLGPQFLFRARLPKKGSL